MIQFIHIPKNGGSSIEHAILGIDTLSRERDRSRKNILYGLVPMVDRIRYGLWSVREWQHLTAEQIKRVVGGRVWRDAFKFTVVRNPWDRMVSWYCYLRRREPFPRWLRTLDTTGTHVRMARLRMNQVDWLLDRDGKLMVNEVLRYEAFDEQLRKLQQRLGMERPIPHIRRSDRKATAAYYDPESIDRVTAIYASDIRYFGYMFPHESEVNK